MIDKVIQDIQSRPGTIKVLVGGSVSTSESKVTVNGNCSKMIQIFRTILILDLFNIA